MSAVGTGVPVGLLSARAQGKAVLLPELVPLPDASPGFGKKAIAELMRKHNDLAAMVGFVGEHVREHGSPGGPGPCPASARELRNLSSRISGQSIGEHAETLRGALSVGGESLSYRATMGVERGGTL